MTGPQSTIIAAAVGAAAAGLGALAGWLGTYLTAKWQHRQKADHLFLTGLEFLGGGTQRRNLGIAAIKLSWRDYPDQQRLCLELLIGSAIYLISESKEKASSHEIYNLRRIMNLVLHEIPYDRGAADSYSDLRDALQKWKPAASRAEKELDRGLHLDEADVEKWKEALQDKAKLGHTQDPGFRNTAKDPSVTYSELCKSYHAIRDFRGKLLGLLPLASGGGIALLLYVEMPRHLIALGVVGVLVTAGLLVYELHNMWKCTELICQGARLEQALGGGQFRVHPVVLTGGCEQNRPVRGLHFSAALLVYLSVMAGWLYVAAAGVWFASQ